MKFLNKWKIGGLAGLVIFMLGTGMFLLGMSFLNALVIWVVGLLIILCCYVMDVVYPRFKSRKLEKK